MGAPFRGSSRLLAHLHWWPMPRFSKYLIFYQVQGAVVVVVRVLHSSRDRDTELEGS